MVTKELDFIYITEDGKKFLTLKEAEEHEPEEKFYSIFNIVD